MGEMPPTCTYRDYRIVQYEGGVKLPSGIYAAKEILDEEGDPVTYLMEEVQMWMIWRPEEMFSSARVPASDFETIEDLPPNASKHKVERTLSKYV